MKIAFIGCGNMGEAILAGIHDKHACYVCEPCAGRQEVLGKKYRVTFAMAADVVAAADTVILAVKPQDLADVLAEMRTLPLKGKRIVSIAAGITTAFVQQRLGSGVCVIRVMPNLPAMVARGVCGICAGAKAGRKDMSAVREIFDTVGTTLVIAEKMMDALTAVSGSGPAYVFLFVESWIAAARRLGFSAEEAKMLVYQTLAGSTKMLVEGAQAPQELRARVTSKGGTTQAAMDVLMAGRMPGVLDAAIKAARRRAKQLSS